jgi:hypothetical protein
MTPPQLPGYTPILNIFEPSVPFGLGGFWSDDQFSRPGALEHPVSSRTLNVEKGSTLIASSARGLQFTHH